MLGRCSAGWWDSVGRRRRVRRLACGAALVVLVAAIWTIGNSFDTPRVRSTSSVAPGFVHGRDTRRGDVAHVLTPDVRAHRSRQHGPAPLAVLVAAAAALAIAAASVRRAAVVRLVGARRLSVHSRAPPLLAS